MQKAAQQRTHSKTLRAIRSAPLRVGTSRGDVPVRVQRSERTCQDVRAAAPVAPLYAARTAQRAVPTIRTPTSAKPTNGTCARVRGRHARTCETHAFFAERTVSPARLLNKNRLALALLDLYSVSVNAWFDDS